MRVRPADLPKIVNGTRTLILPLATVNTAKLSRWKQWEQICSGRLPGAGYTEDFSLGYRLLAKGERFLNACKKPEKKPKVGNEYRNSDHLLDLQSYSSV
jgi:hypothetical protein